MGLLSGRIGFLGLGLWMGWGQGRKVEALPSG